MTPKTIGGRYQLESRIGSGGMGTVWLGTDTVLDRPVAVKMLHEGLASDAAFAERFRREARSAARLAHPNVVAIYDTGEDAGIPFIVMERIQGESLHAKIAREGPLPVEETARIGRSVLSALAHAHERGLVHRDMKPANVLLDPNGGAGSVKVVDFGIAKGLDDTAGLTRTSGLIGTAAYLSPEQVSGRDATPASDLYAVGCLLYACLAGEPPFGGPTAVTVAMKHVQNPVPSIRALRPDVPPAFEHVLMRALDKDPSRRFTSAAEMNAAIAATGLASRPSSTPTVLAAPTQAMPAMSPVPPGTGPRPSTEVLPRGRTAPRRGVSVLAMVTVALVVAAAAALFVLYEQNRNNNGLVDAPLPTPTAALQTLAPVTPSPSPTATPASQAPTTQSPCLNLPGIHCENLGTATSPPQASATAPPTP